MLKSVYTYGGFWIGRYEAGIEGSINDVSKEKITVYFDMDRVCYFDSQTEQRIGRLKEDGKENI